jgi:hypothetical protein
MSPPLAADRASSNCRSFSIVHAILSCAPARALSSRLLNFLPTVCAHPFSLGFVDCRSSPPPTAARHRVIGVGVVWEAPSSTTDFNATRHDAYDNARTTEVNTTTAYEVEQTRASLIQRDTVDAAPPSISCRQDDAPQQLPPCHAATFFLTHVTHCVVIFAVSRVREEFRTRPRSVLATNPWGHTTNDAKGETIHTDDRLEWSV